MLAIYDNAIDCESIANLESFINILCNNDNVLVQFQNRLVEQKLAVSSLTQSTVQLIGSFTSVLSIGKRAHDQVDHFSLNSAHVPFLP